MDNYNKNMTLRRQPQQVRAQQWRRSQVKSFSRKFRCEFRYRLITFITRNILERGQRQSK
jgi:hypothetical protein